MTIRSTTPMRRARRCGAVAFAVAVCAGLAMAQPPSAGATVTRVGVYYDTNYGPLTNFGTACTYTVEARLSSAVGPVSMYDNGILFATVQPTGGVAIAQWSPATRGTHTISAAQSTDSATAGVDVFVGAGIPIGYSCLVI
ncbi:hypothetical protein [Nocardia bovistercoris]|uniref:Ig-like domain repeat protein n=1 Tax=Nocardia bovistercoris TaxID=2785916 RepID=A0A931I8Y6_9NOCA|nr:hypothetical protein [Nocardia bovistercoris]MBH0776501.1 hypothetical protein [Nocardia bovistercoris]